MKQEEKEEKVARWAAWCLQPEDKREPKTQRELALVLGVTEQTLINWRKVPENQDSVSDEAAYLAQVRKQAFKDNPNPLMVKLYGQLTGHLVEKSERTHKFEMTGEQLAKLDRRAEANASRRIKEFHRSPHGVEGGDTGLPLLLDEVRMDTEQEHSTDS